MDVGELTGTDWVLIIGAAGLVLKEGLAIYYANKRAAAAEAKVDEIAAKVEHTAAKVEQTVEKVAEVAAVTEVVKVNTDGTLSALKAANDLLLETNRRQEVIIATFTAVKAMAPQVPVTVEGSETAPVTVRQVPE